MEEVSVKLLKTVILMSYLIIYLKTIFISFFFPFSEILRITLDTNPKKSPAIIYWQVLTAALDQDSPLVPLQSPAPTSVPLSPPPHHHLPKPH